MLIEKANPLGNEANTLNPSLALQVNTARRFSTQPNQTVHTSRIEIPSTGILSVSSVRTTAKFGGLTECPGLSRAPWYVMFIQEENSANFATRKAITTLHQPISPTEITVHRIFVHQSAESVCWIGVWLAVASGPAKLCGTTRVSITCEYVDVR